MDVVRAQGIIPGKRRLNTFLACCPIRIAFDDGSEGLIGRGSGVLIQRLVVTRGRKMPGIVIDIGNFCESASCQIQIGGEHQNDRIFNNSLSSLPLVRGFLRDQGCYDYQASHHGTTRIGHAVTLSRGCIINAGANIGTGAVIGSGAVVTRSPIPAWVTAGGVPARTIGARLSAEQQAIAEELKWWLWDIEYFCRNVHLLLDIERNYSQLREKPLYADDRYRLVVRMEGSDTNAELSILGIDNEDRFVPLGQTPAAFRDYFLQLKAPEDKSLTWLPNPFHLLH